VVAARRSAARTSRAWTARAEFRRRDRRSEWALAGVRLDDRFWPAVPGVEPVRQRLPDTGLLGWAELPSPVIAPTAEEAAAVALDVARAAWPGRVTDLVPFSSGGRSAR
jgi:hypothetical protein